jgi:hypothetical protein
VSAKPLILDTGGWLLALAGVPDYMAALRECSRAVVPGLVLAEVDWHLRARRREMLALLGEIVAGAYVYEPPTVRDLARAREIDSKFRDLSLGLVDASVAALSERLGIWRVLTTDSDFVSIRVGSRWRQAFELAVPLPARE